MVISHNFEFISLTQAIMDVNLTVMAGYLAVLIAMKSVYVKNVYIFNMNGNFVTYDVSLRVGNCHSIKTIGIDQIPFQFDGIDSKTVEISDIQVIILDIEVLYQITLIFFEYLILLSIIQCTMYNMYSISIMTIRIANTTYVAYKIAPIATKSIKFNPINVNLTIYKAITLVVPNTTNIEKYLAKI